MKSALVRSSGAATNNRMLKIIAKTIEPAAAAVPPFFISSLRAFLRWHREQTGHRARYTGEIAFAFNDRRRECNSDLSGLRFLHITKRFVGGIVQCLYAETHRLHQYRTAAQNRQLKHGYLSHHFGKRAEMLTMLPSALRTAMA